MNRSSYSDGSFLGAKIPSEELLPLVYDELRHLAARRMKFFGPEASLQPTALVHEAWLRLAEVHDRCWNDRAHFFRTAAKAIRSVLVDRARRKSALKRNDRLAEVPLDGQEIATAPVEDRLLMIDDVLNQLETEDPASAHIVHLKFFGGLTNRQIAELLDCNERTIERKWSFARMKLYQMIQQDSL
jgi:RNA polymerase sigma factor (TIGR02999 family)